MEYLGFRPVKKGIETCCNLQQKRQVVCKIKRMGGGFGGKDSALELFVFSCWVCRVDSQPMLTFRPRKLLRIMV